MLFVLHGGYFPASGYRYRESGELVFVGSEGLCRSSSPVGSGSVYSANLNFNRTYLNLLNNDSRDAGLSVRCVQAFTSLAIVFHSE